MSPPPDWGQIEAAFDQALERPEDERLGWVEAHVTDPDVRAEVLALLRAHARAGVLDRPVEISRSLDPADVITRALDGRYRIDRELGQGGMSLVFLAYEYKHGRRVVLKVLRPDIAIGDDLADRFQREVQILAQLAHPHVIGFIDSGEAAGMLYYVMPYLEGETLRHRLDRDGAIGLSEAVPLLRDILAALAHAHQRGVMHRDLKPENVLIAEGRAYLMDFGIAKFLEAHSRDDLRMTAEWAVIGTPAYMAPEQTVPGQPVDQRADLYAWGLIAREMLTGEPPRNGPPRGRDLLPTSGKGRMPSGLEAIVARATAEDRGQRPASAAAILEELDGADLSPPRLGVGWWPWVGTAMAGVAALVLFLLLRPEPSGSPLPEPLVVASFTNETGDSTLDLYSRMAGDWLTQGLQETGLVTVVPWPTALEAAEQYRVRGGNASLVRFMRDETGAGTVVTGSLYPLGDSLQFQMVPVNALTGEPIASPRPVVVPRDSAAMAIRELRNRLMGAVGLLTNTQLTPVALGRHPPRYDAYLLFDRAMRKYRGQDYRGSIPELSEAYARDTSFAPTLLYLISAHWNAGLFKPMDSLFNLLRPRVGELSRYQQHRFEFYEAAMRGDGARALNAARASAQAAPASLGRYNFSLTALNAGRVDEALAALRAVDPDRSEMRGWGPYWTQLTHALHMSGDHQAELTSARSHRVRHPDRRVGWVLEARALAAMNRSRELDSLLDAGMSLPPSTYWSQGAMMVTAGEELMAHGYTDEGQRYLARGVNWLRAELGLHPDARVHLYWLGSALYDLARWEEAAQTFQDLLATAPDRFDYAWLAGLAAARAGADSATVNQLLQEPPPRSRGGYLFARGRLSLIRGDLDAGLSLIADALQHGVDGLPWMHASAVQDLALLGDQRRRLPAGVVPER